MYKTVKDVEVNGKYVLVRASLDVPMDPQKDLLDPNRVLDDTRIKDTIPTLKYLVENNAKVVLAAGWAGRPDGEDPDKSMAPVGKKIEVLLKDVLKEPVLIAPNSYDGKPRSVYNNKEEVQEIVSELKEGQIVILENVRYDPEANANDKDFGEFVGNLVGKNAVYVNEAEAQNHRPEATVVTSPFVVAKNGGEVVFGFKYLDVLENIGGLQDKLTATRGSFVFGLCGKKIESDPGITSKITVAYDLIDKMKEGDAIITGGAVIYTFLLAQYYSKNITEKLDEVEKIVEEYNSKINDKKKEAKDKKEAKKITAEIQKEKSSALKELLGITDEDIKNLIGDSYIRWGQEGEQIVFAYHVMEKAKKHGVEVITAYDHVIANNFPDKTGCLTDETEVKVYEDAFNIPKGYLGVGEGPKTLKKIADLISNASIYLQSGPYSIEDDRTEEISNSDKVTFDAALKCKDKGGITIAAGGDTVARVNKRNANNAFSTITSAGGATLELINGDSKGRDAVLKASGQD